MEQTRRKVATRPIVLVPVIAAPIMIVIISIQLLGLSEAFRNVQPSELIELLKKLPEPNEIDQADIDRIYADYNQDPTAPPNPKDEGASSSSESGQKPPAELTSDDFDLSTMYKARLASFWGNRWALSYIWWSSRNRITFLAQQDSGYEIYIMVRQTDKESGLWTRVLATITNYMNNYCNGDILNCEDKISKVHLALMRGYNFAVSMDDRDRNSFIIVLLIKDATGSQTILHRHRDIVLKYEPLLDRRAAPGGGEGGGGGGGGGGEGKKQQQHHDVTYTRALYHETTLLDERPKNVDHVAFFVIATDQWDDAYVTQEIRQYMCNKYYQQQRQQPGATDQQQISAQSSEWITDKDIALETSYWYARRFVLPPKEAPILSNGVLIILLRPLSEICIVVAPSGS